MKPYNSFLKLPKGASIAYDAAREQPKREASGVSAGEGGCICQKVITKGQGSGIPGLGPGQGEQG